MENISLEKQTIRILFLASEPSNAGKLRLGAELQEVRNRLSTNSSFEIKDRQAVKPDDVLQTILNYKPHIVHFSGHGQNTGEICFEDEKGDSKTIPPDALASLFKLVNDYVKCVLVNTCFSEKQAKAISQYVPIVIGTRKEISDSAAIKFSTGFYTALDPDLSQKSLVKAFDSGCIAIRFENLPENLTPIMIEGSPEVRFSSEVDTAFLSVSKAKGHVFTALHRGLTLTGKKMGLPDETVSKILDEKVARLELHDVGVIEYEQYLKDILKDEYPLSDTSTLALLQLKNGLDLTNEDVDFITKKILSDPNLASAEKWYDRAKVQYDLNNIEKAITYFTESIEKDSDYSGAYYERGYCYDKIGEFNAAIQDFTKAIEFNNKWEVSSLSLAYYSRARAYHAIKSDDQNEQNELLLFALADWNKSIELNPNDSEAYYGRALVYDNLNDLEKAIIDFKKSYEMSSTDERKRNNVIYLAKCYHTLGITEEFEKWMKLLKGDTSDTLVVEN
jgi:tetratricopeptide (TPR) repeat protein